MEKSEVSLHEVRVWRALKEHGGWLSNKEIGERIEGVGARTVRLHTKRLVELGMLDIAEVFPSHRFRVSDKASKRNAAYARRLELAGEAMGA